jgi:hypothetical protein
MKKRNKMKISDLKQPYRRMAEYLAERNINPRRNDKTFLLDAFDWDITNDLFWDDIDNGNYPEITEEIKQHFPSDFDFSGEDESLNQKYTQLAKEGKFDELPDTCEFSEPVELEVWDDDGDYLDKIEISGKYKGYYIDCTSTGLYSAYQHAQLPTKKIDFMQFQTGDVVEVVSKDDSFFLGYFSIEADENIEISYAKNERVGLYPILKKHIKSITKIK